MKYIYLLGFIMWFIIAYYSFLLIEKLTLYFSGASLIFEIFLFITIIIITFFGLHKIVLSFVMFNDIKNPNFNIISTIYSLIAIVGIAFSYFSRPHLFDLFYDTTLHGIFTVSFMLLLIWIFFSGLIVFPKKIKRK